MLHRRGTRLIWKYTKMDTYHMLRYTLHFLGIQDHEKHKLSYSFVFFMNNKKNTIFGKSHNVWKLLKMSYFSFSFLAFPTNFSPLKIDCASEYHYFLHFLCFRNVCLRSTLAGFNPLSDAECSILHYVDDKCATPVLSNRENCWIISLTRNQILLISN